MEGKQGPSDKSEAQMIKEALSTGQRQLKANAERWRQAIHDSQHVFRFEQRCPKCEAKMFKISGEDQCFRCSHKQTEQGSKYNDKMKDGKRLNSTMKKAEQCWTRDTTTKECPQRRKGHKLFNIADEGQCSKCQGDWVLKSVYNERDDRSIQDKSKNTCPKRRRVKSKSWLQSPRHTKATKPMRQPASQLYSMQASQAATMRSVMQVKHKNGVS